MLISVTSPRHGMGQTLTSINFAAALTQRLGNNVLLIDMNKQYSDVENYLSDTKITKGLDDFICLHNSNILNKDSFRACIKTIHKVDIMSSNECLELENKMTKVLLEYSKISYETIIIDTICGKNPISNSLFEQSDIVVVVLNQSKHILDMICKTDLYQPYKGKLLFIVNKFMDKYEDKKNNLGVSQIASQLKGADLGQLVFPLAFEMDIINDCNDNAILNRVLNNNLNLGKYSKQLGNITNYLLYRNDNSKILTEKKKKGNFLNLLRIKGAAPFAT